MASMEQLPVGLLSDVKNYLNITWEDKATDDKVSGLISLGMFYLKSKFGNSTDFLVDGIPRALLFDYVRYTMDGALDIFESNYQSLIITAINERRVAGYAQKADQTQQ